ncbi:MAG TPA: Spy/CpxP family protein refolding chaperone [Rubrivivax sp.]|nr:Spy/CpxP family protein refolding chaperone [Rubrivivax sp.]
MRKHSTALAALAALALATTVAAQPYGPGMMGGGPGPGGYGGGPGMMGGAGGMGPGMMGGWGGGGFADLDLSKEQRDKIADIQGDVRRQRWTMMRSMQQQEWHMADAWREGSFDEQAARKAFDAMSAQHKAMFDVMIDAQKRIDAVLTPEQREQLKRRWGGR